MNARRRLEPARLRRHALTPDALEMLDAIARRGSFAAAARELGRVPSALTYSVRQLEETLDVLLFDRSSRQARLTAAGEELLAEARRLLGELDAVANRVHRVATGWESHLTIAADGVIARATVFDLIQAFSALSVADAGAARDGPHRGPPTQITLRSEILTGTWEALLSGQADLAIGTAEITDPPAGVQTEPLGTLAFVFVVAPGHPLAQLRRTIGDAELARHRAIAVADSARRLSAFTANILPGQDVLTVATVQEKLEAQLRGLGCGFLPEPIARAHIAAGRLVACRVQRAERSARLGYAWRASSRNSASCGLALRWWLTQLGSPATRKALLDRPDGCTLALRAMPASTQEAAR